MYPATIGIVGMGFVGEAVYRSFSDLIINTVTVDLDPDKTTGTYEDLLECDAVFVCVPTPMGKDGECDTSILDDVLSKLAGAKGVIISKSTATPSHYAELNKLYPNLVHSPEFLTANNAYQDYLNATFAFIGGDIKAYKNEAERIIKLSQPNVKDVYHSSISEAALAKYAINTFLATKVVFMNELKALADSAGIDYKVVSTMISTDHRIGSSHLRVPGPEGLFGFGGACFPKDTSALLKYAESLGVNMSVLDAAVKKNILLRLTEPK